MNNEILHLQTFFALLLICFFLFLSCNFILYVWILTNEINTLFEQIERKISKIITILVNFIKNKK